MNKDVKARIGENGRIVIPASFRKALGIPSGGEVVLHLDKDGVKITTTKLRIAEAQRKVRKYIPAGISLVDELILERRAESQKDLK